MSAERRRPRKWLRRVLLGAVVLGAVLLWVVIGAIGFLQSGVGGRFVRDKVVTLANEKLSGSLDVAEVDFRGDGLLLRDVVLKDPDGEVVAEVDEVAVELGLLSLTRKTARIESVRITRPELHVVQDAEGTNLQRALEPREKKPEEPKKDSELPVDIAVDQVVLEDGLVSFEQVDGARPLSVTLNDLDMKGRASVRDGGDTLDADLEADGDLSDPLEGPVKLVVKATGAGGNKTLDLDFRAADALLVARAEQQGEENATVELKQLEVPSYVARAFAPTYPVIATLRATARVEKKAADVTADASVQLGSGTIDVDAQVNTDTMVSSGVKIVGQGLNLEELVMKGPPSKISFTIEGSGGGKDPDAIDGELLVTAPASRIEDATFGPVRIHATAEDGYFFLRHLDAKVPGVAITARGEGDKERVKLYGRAAAKDLALFGRTLGKLAGPEGIPVAGNGALAFSVEGPVKEPAVSATGQFPLLAYEKNRIRDLRLKANVPNAKQPLAGDATVDVRASNIALADKQLVQPRLSMTMRDGVVALTAHTRGFAQLDLAARGALDADRKGLALSEFTLAYPEARWRLEKPARVRLDGDELALKDFALRSGRQRIALDAAKDAQRLNAAVDIDALALERLPRAFVKPELQLRGALSVDARATGRVSDPNLTATVSLVDARVKQYDDIDVNLDLAWRDQRAEGKLQATAMGMRAHGDFDVPVEALQKGRAEKVSANLVLEDLAIESVLAELGKPMPVRGRAGATVKLSGTARDPRLVAEVHGREVVYETQPPMDLDLAAKTDSRGRLVARVDLTAQGKTSYVALETPWTLGRLIRKPPTAEQALHAAIALSGKFDDLPLPIALGASAARPPANQNLVQAPTAVPPAPQQGTGGSGPQNGAPAQDGYARLNGELDIQGTALAPRGGAELTVSNIRAGDQPPLDTWVKLALAPRSARVQLKVEQQDNVIAQANAALDGPLARLRKPNAFARIPVSVDATWGPIGLMELQQLAPPSPHPDAKKPPILTGVLRGTLKVAGTLNDPRVNLDTSVHGLGSAQTAALGDVSIRYDYADAKNSIAADLISGEAGRMQLRASTPIDLSFRALKKGLAWKRAPVDAKLTATQFDPSFLSGVSPKLLKVGGNVEADVAVGGHLSLPNVNGKLEWKDGVLALAGSGSYEKVHLLVHGTQDRVVLEDLSASAGEGRAQLTAVATRAGESVNLEVKTNLREFPVIAEDQLAATLSLDATAKGTASLALIDTRVDISEAHVELPETAKRDLQKLEPAEDVSFLVNGQPLDDPEPKKQAKAAGTAGKGATSRGAGGSAAAGTGPTDEREIRVAVNAPRNLWVKGKDLNVEIGLGENFRVVMVEEPEIFGDVKVIRGRVEVMGKRFDLDEESSVTFGGPMLAPRLNVVAVHENEREDITVTLRVTGAADDIQIQPTSDPPLSETEIYTLLATGRRSLRPGTGSANKSNPAASVLGSLAAAQLKKGLEEALPLDVLSIEAGDRGIGGTRVEAGMYVTDRLYMGIETQIGAQRELDENQNEIHLEYQLWKRWMLELEYGDARQGTGDLIWRKQY